MPSERTRVPTYPDLAEKVAVVTGSSRGIGAATALAFAANGTRVAVNGRDHAAIDHTLGEIRSIVGQARGIAADCTRLPKSIACGSRSRPSWDLSISGGLRRGWPCGPRLDRRAHRGGMGFDDRGNAFPDVSDHQEFLPGMIDRRRGSIITMASSAARLPVGGPAAYAAAKAGVIMLSRQSTLMPARAAACLWVRPLARSRSITRTSASCFIALPSSWSTMLPRRLSPILQAATLIGSGSSFVQPGQSDGSAAAHRQADVKILTSELHVPVSTR